METDPPGRRRRYLVITSGESGPERFNLEESARLTGMHREMILTFLEGRYVQPACTDDEGRPYFDHGGLLRLRRIEQLRSAWGIDLRVLPKVVGLLDRLEAAEEELRVLRERLR